MRRRLLLLPLLLASAVRASVLPANCPEPSERRLPYMSFIREAADRHGVDAALIEAVIAAESNFQPMARSRAGASGLMQLMPLTARKHGCTDPFDVSRNIDAGARHLAELLDEFGGNRPLALAAYNAGSGAVRKAGGIPPYPETRRYIRKVEGYLAQLAGSPLPPDFEAATRPVVRAAVPQGAPLRLLRDANGRLMITNLAPPEGGSVAVRGLGAP